MKSKHDRNRTFSLAVVLLLMFTLFEEVGCKKNPTGYMTATDTGMPGMNEVWMQNAEFMPASIFINRNTSVKWINNDGMMYTVTSDDGVFNSGGIASGEAYVHLFTIPGTFAYHCTIHRGMSGKVIVK